MEEKPDQRTTEAPLHEASRVERQARLALRYLWIIPAVLVVRAAVLAWWLHAGLPVPLLHDTLFLALIFTAAYGLVVWKVAVLTKALIAQSREAKTAQDNLSAAAIENTRLLEVAQRRTTSLQTLARSVGEALSSGLDTRRIAELVIQQAVHIIHSDRAAITLRDTLDGAQAAPIFHVLAAVDSTGAATSELIPDGSKQDYPFLETVFSSEQVAFIPDAHTDERLSAKEKRIALAANIRSMMLAPMRNRKHEVTGLLVLTWLDQPYAPSEEEFHAVETLAAQAAVAIENTRLYQQLSQTQETLRQQLITIERAAEAEHLRANEMAATLGSMTDGVILCGADGQIQQVNRAAEEILGHQSSEMLGDCSRWADTVGLRDGETSEAVQAEANPLTLALRMGRSCPRRVYLVQTASGQERFIELVSTPVTDETGRLNGAVAVFHDITALRSIAAREAAARSRIDLLLQISQKLNASMDLSQINEIVVRGAFELAMGRCDLKQTAIYRYDRTGSKITRVARFPKSKPKSAQAARRTGRLSRPGLAAPPEDISLPVKPGPTYLALYVKRSAVVTWLPEEQERDKSESGYFAKGTFDTRGDEETGQVAVRLPLVAQGEVLGHLSLYADSLPDAGHKDGDGGDQAALLSALSSLASLAAISIYNAQLYERVQQRAQQMTTLWSVGKAISAHLDVGEIADTLSDQIRQVLGADLCVLSLYEGGRLAPQGRAAEKAPDFTQAAGLAECECDLIMREAARRSTPISQANIESMAPGRCRWRRAGRLPGTHSVLAAPLVFDAETLGVLTVYRGGTVPFTQEESDLITTLGSLSVAALRNARSFEHEHNIAETLQTFFLTSPPANVPGFDIAERYYPPSQEAKIGGDYFDFIPLSSTRLAILIGDISGKGLTAAAYTAMAKYTLRAFTSTPNIQPSHVVDFTNLAMTRHTSGEIFSTLFYGVLDFAANTLTYVNAGHEPPLILRRGEALMLEPTGTMVGAFPETSYDQEVVHLQPGDVLALYTDGLTDVRSPIGAFFTGYGVADVLKKLPPSASASEMAASLYSSAKEFCAGVIDDDIALLIVKAL